MSTCVPMPAATFAKRFMFCAAAEIRLATDCPDCASMRASRVATASWTRATWAVTSAAASEAGSITETEKSRFANRCCRHSRDNADASVTKGHRFKKVRLLVDRSGGRSSIVSFRHLAADAAARFNLAACAVANAAQQIREGIVRLIGINSLCGKNREKLAISLGTLALFACIAPGDAAAAAVCTPTGFVRDSINLTAALINPGDVTGDVDATGCNIGIYYNQNGRVRNANVHGANYFGIVNNGANVEVANSTISDIGEKPFNGTQHGVAIYFAFNSAAKGNIHNNYIWNYQKGGIVVNGPFARAETGRAHR